MNIKKLIKKIAGKTKQPKTQKVKVDINYVQSHVEPSSFFGQIEDTIESDNESSKTTANN